MTKQARVTSAVLIGIIIGVVATSIGYGIYSGVFIEPAEKQLIEPAKNQLGIKEVELRVVQFEFIPDTIEVVKGTKVIIYVVESSCLEEREFSMHTFTLSDFQIREGLPQGTGTIANPIAKIEFVADEVGEFMYECDIFCGTNHPNMKGKLIVTETEGSVIEKPTMLKLDDINATLQVLKTEDTLPSSPVYFDENDLEYLMLAIQREGGAIYAANGKTLEGIKNITGVGVMPHVIVYNPVETRWAYVIARDGWLSKIDLWSLDVVRKIQTGYFS